MNFSELGLGAKLVAKVTKAGLSTPTPIQDRAIPLVLQGRDVMGLAQTGTGKTAAFGLPLIDLLTGAGNAPAPGTVRSLILAPTRELTRQICDTLASYVGDTHLKVGMVVGGVSIRAQIARLERGTDILVATPGRLLDLLERRALTLDNTRFLVLDEADQMLDLGFVHALRKIAKLLPDERQTLLFSATMPKQMAELAETYLNRPVRIEVAPPGKPADKVTQAVHFVAQADKTALLKEYLDTHRGDLALVFSRTKHGAEKLMKHLVAAGFAAGSIHGNKSQGQRDRALKAFRERQIRVLVATDVAARGIDIPGVRHVYNYDLPNVPENYVHRIGRTARAGADGIAVAFCAPAEMSDFRGIEKIIGIKVEVVGGAPWQAERGTDDQKKGGSRGGHKRRARPSARSRSARRRKAA